MMFLLLHEDPSSAGQLFHPAVRGLIGVFLFGLDGFLRGRADAGQVLLRVVLTVEDLHEILPACNLGLPQILC